MTLRRFYRENITRLFRFHIPPGSDVLEIGCNDGYLLDSLRPRKGVGIDNNKNRLRKNKKKYPQLSFIEGNPTDYNLKGAFDYVIISDSISHFTDVQAVLHHLRKNCTHETRIIINHYNHLWEPFLLLAEWLGIKRRQPLTNWLAQRTIISLLETEDFDIVKTGQKVLLPISIPLIAPLMNRYVSQLPLINSLCLIEYVVARPVQLYQEKEKSVSVIVPARNEKGNIESIVKNMPSLGKGTEIVFVEGGSKDDTWEEIRRVQRRYKDKRIKSMRQDGKGKYDAVKKGFENATGDILMIYDADRTVPEKDLLKFYDAMKRNKGEFIFGSRLTYPMEKEAMRTLNHIGNKMFSIMFTWILGQPIHDTLCGTKVISKKHYEKLAANRKYFGDFDPFGDFDLILGSAKMDLKSVEIPIRYKSRTYGSTNISRFTHGWLLIKMVAFSLGKMKFTK